MPASITLTVAHLPTSTSFFLSVLQPLNYVFRGRVNDTIGFGYPDAAPDFWLTQSIPGVPPGPAHVAFPATSRGIVHDFFHAALKAGGKVHGEPAVRDDCGYYSAAIIDFDGNSIEAVFRPDLIEANKENIDDAKSSVSMTKSVKSKTPSVVSSASKTKSIAPSKVGSVAPSQAAKSSVSKAPSAAPSRVSSAASSKAPTQASRSITISGAPNTVVSKASTAAPAASEVPARTTISRAPTAPAAPQGAGNSFFDLINEAKGTVAFAREVVNQARPLMSGPSPVNNNPGATGASSDSHAPSDAIVGTLLGVAAGAALHYAWSNHINPREVASAPVTPPERYNAVARSESNPSWTEERYYYYHQQPQAALPAPSQVASTPYAIEAPPSDFSRASGSRSGGQRLIEMIDHAPSVSEVTGARSSTIRPGRRSSFSDISAARTKTSRATAKSNLKILDAAPPPTSYRAPTAITMASDTRTTRSRSHSRASSQTRTVTRPSDEGYASATEDRKSKISSSSRKSRSRAHSTSRHSTASKNGSSVVTAIRTTPENTPLPASRAASYVDKHNHSDGESAFYSTHSKAAKTVIGRLTERQLQKLEDGGRLEKGQTDVSRSVIGKVKAVDGLDVSRKELRPEDSVSQVSSSRGSRRSSRR